MEARTLRVFLRVLYTVNNNPQYILAKSSCQVPVIACNDATSQPATNDPAYARAPLKSCLAAVCDSSPELLQDPGRDFSLYFLDPLEAQPLPTGLAQAPHNTSSPRGVAVALGLMSWALESNDSMNVFVTGTIVPNASPALEVVCALRETRRMPKPMLHSYPPLGSTISSQLPHPLHPLQGAGIIWSFNSHPQLDRQHTLTRSADFPEVYIGPPRRARGRPEGSSSKSKAGVQALIPSLPGSSSSNAVDSQSESKQAVFKQKTKPKPPRSPPAHSPFICAPLTRNAGTAGREGDGTGVSDLNRPSHLKHESPTNSQNQPHIEIDCQPQSRPHLTHDLLAGLLSTLSTASGTSAGNTTPEQRAALISVLQGLLVTNPHLLQPPVAGEGLAANIGEQASQDVYENNSAGDEHDDGDSDIVILDSSTIDTTVFHRASARQSSTSKHDTSPFTLNQESPMPNHGGIDSSPLPSSTSPSVQENTSVPSQISTSSDVPESISTVTADLETPGRNSSGWVGKSGNTPDMPTTPTPSQTRKRKLDEYSQDQTHRVTSFSPLSPSPSVARTSRSSRPGTSRNRAQSSPTGGTKSMSSPSKRLPSMLGFMRGIVASQSGCYSGPSKDEHPALTITEKTGSQLTTLVSKSRADPNITSEASSLKRRRTLTEFMAEQEARKSLKTRKQSSSERKLEAAPRPTNLKSSSKYAQSSPPRPMFRSDSEVSALQPPALTLQSNVVSSMVTSNPAPPFTTTSTSIGSSMSTSTTQPKNPLKNFVVPAWARTSTATLPRLSEEVLARQKAEQEAKKAQVSQRRREVARAKRKQPHRASRPSKYSSDEDDETAAGDTRRRTLLPSSPNAARNAPVSETPPTLPVFASDGVAPIAPSPPRSHIQPVLPAVLSTPPKKPISLPGSGLHHTPSKSGSHSLFTPSGQDSMSLFTGTPSTPSVTRSQTRSRFTPRSPTALRHAGGAKISPRKGDLQTPHTPRRNDSGHRTPGSLRTDKQLLFASPSLANRSPQTQTGMGTRAFLLPPPSPCAPRIPQGLRQVSGLTPFVPHISGTLSQAPSPDTCTQGGQRKDCDGEETNDKLNCEMNKALGEHAATSPMQRHPSRENTELNYTNTDDDVDPVEEEYGSSSLPPSSPLPVSPLSSPCTTKYHDNYALPDADSLRAVDMTWLLSDDGVDPTAAWLTDSDAGTWLTETEAWLTDTEGEPLPTESDGAWLSDSDAVSSVFGNLAPPLRSWLSDGADVEETDGEVGVEMRTAVQDDAGFDTADFQRAYESLVGLEGDADGAPSGDATLGPATLQSEAGIGRPIKSGFWESMRPLLGEGASNDMRAASGTPHDVQALLESLVGT